MKQVSNKSKWIVGGIAVAVFFGIFVLRFATMDSSASPPSISQLHQKNGIPVDVTEVTEGAVEQTIRLIGTLEGIAEADINSQIPMRINRILVESGQKVQKNQRLVALDPLSMLMMYSNLESSRIQYSNAKRDMERMRPLFEAGAISESDWDAIKAGVAQAKAGVNDHQHAMTLMSPIQGTVTRVFNKPGDVVATGHPILTVSRTDRMKLVVNVTQEQVALLSVGNRAVIEVPQPGGKKAEVEGEVLLIDLAAHPVTRLFRVELVFDNPNQILRSGTVQKAKIVVARSENTKVIPTRSVIEMDGRPHVFRVSENTASFVPIETGIANMDVTQVTGGLADGDTVVVVGTNMLDKKQESKVQIHDRIIPTAVQGK